MGSLMILLYSNVYFETHLEAEAHHFGLPWTAKLGADIFDFHPETWTWEMIQNFE